MKSSADVDLETLMSFSTRRIAAGLSLDDVVREFAATEADVRAWEAGIARPPARIVNSLEGFGRAGGSETPAGKKPRQAEFASMIDPGPLFKSASLIKSKQRVADHGEVFTPEWLVERMLDLVKGESERIDARFLEPACGSGNFLVPILQRKLAAVELKYGRFDFEKRHHALQALTCCYGIELLADNIAECRANMLDVFAAYLNLDEDDDLYRAASEVLSLNLIHGDAMTMRGADGEPIIIVEWGYLGRGKFNRRDFRLDALTEAASFKQQAPLFREVGEHPIFKAIGFYPPMTVAELAARDRNRA